jgi:hypothetical protein
MKYKALGSTGRVLEEVETSRNGLSLLLYLLLLQENSKQLNPKDGQTHFGSVFGQLKKFAKNDLS